MLRGLLGFSCAVCVHAGPRRAKLRQQARREIEQPPEGRRGGQTCAGGDIRLVLASIRNSLFPMPDQES